MLQQRTVVVSCSSAGPLMVCLAGWCGLKTRFRTQGSWRLYLSVEVLVCCQLWWLLIASCCGVLCCTPLISVLQAGPVHLCILCIVRHGVQVVACSVNLSLI